MTTAPEYGERKMTSLKCEFPALQPQTTRVITQNTVYDSSFAMTELVQVFSAVHGPNCLFLKCLLSDEVLRSQRSQMCRIADRRCLKCITLTGAQRNSIERNCDGKELVCMCTKSGFTGALLRS
jgi:hypothetical protein